MLIDDPDYNLNYPPSNLVVYHFDINQNNSVSFFLKIQNHQNTPFVIPARPVRRRSVVIFNF